MTQASTIPVHCAHDEIVDITTLVPNPRNPNTHPDKQIALLSKIIRNQGWRNPIVVSNRSGFIVKGHGRLEAAKLLQVESVPIDRQDYETEADEWADMIADNRIAELADIDKSAMKDLLTELDTGSFDMDLTGFDEQSLNIFNYSKVGEAKATLTERFGAPPFSVLDARQGYWQERKRSWINLGIKSEVGRKEGLLGFSAAAAITLGGKKPQDSNFCETTSVFDPVLCELAYRWFMPKNGKILDPFAGGSVRGIVASMLGHDYTGIDLRSEQIEANKAQGEELCKDHPPHWIIGDSRHIKDLAPGEYDFIFSCPPYGDLEVYSENPSDLSNMDFDQFIEAYRSIITSTVSMLKPNRFACFVVGDFRDKDGYCRNFPALTIEAFLAAGMTLYNEAILVTVAGSLPIRVGKQFITSRKLGKTHQNVLVFFKGDTQAIRAWGEPEFGAIENEEQDGARN